MSVPTLAEVLRQAVAPNLDGAPLTVGPATVEVLGDSVQVAEGATVVTRILPTGARVEAFDGRLSFPPRDDQVFGELLLVATAHAAHRPRIRHGSLRIRPTTARATRLEYRFLCCLPRVTFPKQASQLLLTSVRPPHRVVLSELEPCEVHSLSTDMCLELGLELACGDDLELPLALDRGVPARVNLAATAAVRAWAGLELEDRISLEVGRAGLLDPSRVRIRLRRVRQRHLTLGAKLALEVSFDARRAAHAVLDAALSCPGLVRVAAALDELGQLEGAVEALARGDFDTLRRQLSDEAAEVVSDFLGQDGAWTTITSTASARALVDGARRLVTGVKRSDALVQSLWDRLVRADAIGPTLEALERISRVDEEGLGGLLDPAATRTVDLLETLSGLDLENLAIGGEEAEQALDRAATLAGQALELHRRLTALTEGFRKRLDAYLRRTSLAGVLRSVEALTDPDALRGYAGRFLGGVAEQLLDLPLDEIGSTDLDTLKERARDLLALVDATGPSSLDATLRAAADRLGATHGFSAALELDRLSRSGQLLDVELDPGSGVAAGVQRELAHGDVAGAVAVLFAAADRLGDGEPPPFLIRDCVLTSRRARTTATSVLSALVGLERGSCRRVTEAEVAVAHGADGTLLERRARHAGGLVASTRSPDGTTTQLQAWLTWRCLGSTRDLAAPYDPPLEPDLRLAVTRQGSICTRDELEALDALLHDLGFLPAPGRFQGLLDTAAVRLSLTVRLPRRPFEALLVCLDREDDVVRQAWCRDFDNALHRWFSDPFVPRLDPYAPDRSRLGATLAGVVRSRWYRSTCERAAHELDPVARCHGRSVGDLPYLPVLTAVTSRGLSLRALGRLARRYRSTASGARDAELLEASQEAGRGFAASSPLLWPNPMLLLWLVHARLCRKAPHLLELASGVATVRWRSSGEDRWDSLERMTLEHGLRAHPVGEPGSIFPV